MSTTNPNSVPANKFTTRPVKRIKTLKRLLISLGLIAFSAQLSAQRAHKFPTPKPTEGNYNAMYLAGLIADDARMTKKDLQRWADKAYAGSLPGATVPWIAAGSSHGREIALKWIESPKPLVACAGWSKTPSTS